MKTNEELKQIKNEYESLKAKLSELTEDEMQEIAGGSQFVFKDDSQNFDINMYKNKVEDNFPTKVDKWKQKKN